MKTRKVKLYRKYRRVSPNRCRVIPELRVSGDWLIAAGFAADRRVEIEVTKNQLIIKIVE